MGCQCGKATAVDEVSVQPVAPNNAGAASSSNASTTADNAKRSSANKGPAPSADIISKKVAQAKKTGVLALRECGLKVLPPGATASDFSNMRTADLTANALKALPEAVGTWRSLQNLLCSQNALAKLPEAFGQLTSLQKIVLSDNQLSTLPAGVALLGKLRLLALDNNKLGPRLSDVFNGEVSDSLEDLDLSGNGLQELPPSLLSLRAVTRMVLARNEFRALPEALGSLSRLQHLDAANNLLRSVPATLFEISSLSELWLRGNPMDRLELQETPGFTAFLERRKQRIDTKIDCNVVGAIDLSVCGLD